MRTVKIVLEWVSVPVLLISFQLPQGMLLYWLTNSTYSILTSFALSRERIKQLLGVPVRKEQPGPAELPSQAPHDTLGSEEAMSDELKAQFEQAAQYRVDNKLEEALKALSMIAAANPDLAQGHYAMGRLLSEMKQWDKASESYSLAGELLGESQKVKTSQGFLFAL